MLLVEEGRMGCAQPGGVSQDSKEINKVLVESRKREASLTKVLLIGMLPLSHENLSPLALTVVLGAGEAGKT